MSEIATPIIDWLNANPELAGLATFIISAAESIAIIGTIVPGSVMMTAIGALVGAGVIPFWHTLIWAILGAIAGDGVSYWLGYHFKDHIYDVWPFKHHPKILQAGEVFFRKHGSMSVFIGRFIGPVRALVPVVAGMFGMRPILFTIANVTSAILWAPVYMLPGFILGAASTELPSEVAGHLVLSFLLWVLFIFLCYWLLRKSFHGIRNKVNDFLTWTWDSLEKSRYFSVIVSALKHYDRRKTRHGQLRMAFYLVLVCVIFFYLALLVLFQGSANIGINKVTFYFFRGLRSPAYDNAFLFITFLGDKKVLLPVMMAVFGWLIWNKHRRLAWHTLALGILLAGSTVFFKHVVHSTRPWGVLNNFSDGFSFPSGHAALSFGFYIGIALLCTHLYKLNRPRPLFMLMSVIVIAVALSRLYFGVHWFTDIIGSWLLASAVLMVVTMSYNRHASESIHPKGVILTLIISLLIAYSINVGLFFSKTKHDFTKIEWPTYTISKETWWSQTGSHLPLYRINRFGSKTKVFNLQWIGSLDDIHRILLANGWESPPPSDWVSILYRLSSVDSTAHLPLVLPLYLDHPPVLIMTKLLNSKRLLILRFWNANLTIEHAREPLWVGLVEIAPSTYSWLSTQKHYPEAGLQSSWIFSKPLPSYYESKMIAVKVKTNHHHSKNIPMILIKPKK